MCIKSISFRSRITLFFVLSLSVLFLYPLSAKAEVKDIGNGIKFDHEYYASLYPDAVLLVGNTEEALLNHYQQFGILQGRTAYAGQAADEIENLRKALADQLNTASESGVQQPADSGTERRVLPPAALTNDALNNADQITVNGQESIPLQFGIEDQKQGSKGLVLVYLNGSDLESRDSSGLKNINQMIAASAAGNTRFV
ncbi:MAG: hypothetical protein K6B28_10310, partial [Lachnospiraceae bacterium]|nr:hypothetical protein [Lachnospiraceae bacterium]